MPEISLEEDPKVVAPVAEATPEEVTVEIADDPLYKKPDWKTDPAANVEDTNDKDYGQQVQKRINRLRASLSEAAKQRDKASAEREESLNLARAYQQKIASLEHQLASGTAMYIERQADTEDAHSKLHESALKAALIAGDPDKIAQAQSDLATARAKATQYRGAAEFRKAQIQAPPPAPQPVQQRQASDESLTRWQTDNPWFNTDQEMTEAALEVHDDLAAKGVRVGSPAYYKAIDASVKTKFPDYFGEEAPVTPPAAVVPAAKPVSVTPPATRTAVSSQANTVTNGTVKLTQSQVATATRLGLTPQQYAKTLVQLRKEGMSV